MFCVCEIWLFCGVSQNPAKKWHTVIVQINYISTGQAHEHKFNRTGWQSVRQTGSGSSGWQQRDLYVHNRLAALHPSSNSVSQTETMEEKIAKLHVSSGESTGMICLQVFPSYLLAGLGTLMAGMLLDQAQVSTSVQSGSSAISAQAIWKQTYSRAGLRIETNTHII